jgi:hypothetical protein
MNETDSQNTALRLLAACSAEDVTTILSDQKLSYDFSQPENWKPYGNRDKNWDTVGNQQSSPIGALTELITNGIDAILLRKARENGVTNFRSLEAPQSMFEAVNRYFPQVVDGRIFNLSPKQRTDLAEKCLLVGIKRAARKDSIYPTYTVVDFGDGQKPEDFPKTFLSLSEKNKEGIPFVQGKFNMGSTGSLRFCTRSDIRLGHYKFIISKRPDSDYWGWTLIRVRGPKSGEQLPVAEYFSPNGVPRFRSTAMSAFGRNDLGQVESGTIIKLYEFDIGRGANAVDFGLRDALDVNLIDCALPIRSYDFDAKPQETKGPLRAAGIAASTFSGLSVTIGGSETPEDEEKNNIDEGENQQANEGSWTHLVTNISDPNLGRIKILAIGIKKMKDSLATRQAARVFYTVNGQTQARERASFLSTRAGYGDLRNHLLVNIVCDDMDKTAMSTIFMPDRERKADTVMARMLEDMVIDALKRDDKIRAFANEIRLSRAKEHSAENEESAELLQDLAKADPAIKELFGLGVLLPEITKTPGGVKVWDQGKKFPTFLTPLNLKKEDGKYVKEIPINSYRRIECGTDAEDGYLVRKNSPGIAWSSLDIKALAWRVSLRSGTATFTIMAPDNVTVGDTIEAEFGFMDQGANPEPLKFVVTLRFTAEEKTNVNRKSPPTKTRDDEKKNLGMPYFEWVNKSEWAAHTFNEESGAYISLGEKTTVYINRDNRYLELMRVSERDEAERITKESIFKLGLGIFALSVHRKATEKNKEEEGDDIDPDDFVRLATGAIAAHIITVIRHLGAGVRK